MPPLKIQLVDDETHFILSLKFILETNGYKVTNSSANGIEALDKFAEDKPDIIILDVGLKGPLNGPDVAEKIRETSNTPILFVTGYSDSEMETFLNQFSNSLYLNKPIETEELLSRLNSLAPQPK